MKILDLYKSLLKAASSVVSEDGFVSKKFGDNTDPFLVKGKRLVLPTQEHLSNPDWKDRVVFHPLNENILRGESTVMEEFRAGLNANLHMTISMLMFSLLVLGTSASEHSKLTPDQSEFLSKVKNADEKTLENFQKLLKVMNVKQSNNVFVNIYLKRAGKVNNIAYRRAGIVTFPFYNELVGSTNHEVYGVKLRVKDVETFKNLFEYIFPQAATPEAYNCGSNSTVAPYLDSLMHAFMSIASPINDQITLMGSALEEVKDLMIESEWVESFDNLEALLPEIRAIPMQAGNEGAAVKSGPSAGVAATPSAPVAVAPTPTSPLPPQLQTTYGVAPSPMPFAGHTHAGPGIVETNRGLDFDSVIRNIPALAQQFGGPRMNPMQGGRQEQAPNWARPNVGGYQAPVMTNQGWQNPSPMNYGGGRGRGII